MERDHLFIHTLNLSWPPDVHDFVAGILTCCNFYLGRGGQLIGGLDRNEARRELRVSDSSGCTHDMNTVPCHPTSLSLFPFNGCVEFHCRVDVPQCNQCLFNGQLGFFETFAVINEGSLSIPEHRLFGTS